MDMTDGQSAVLTALGAAVCRDHDVTVVVVFGSHATDDARPSSDIDIAVKFADDLSSHERSQKRCFLSGELQRAAAPFIDVSDIDALPLGVAHDAVNGQFLSGDDQSFHELKTDIDAAFAEARDDIRRPQQAVIDRIAEEGLRG